MSILDSGLYLYDQKFKLPLAGSIGRRLPSPSRVRPLCSRHFGLLYGRNWPNSDRRGSHKQTPVPPRAIYLTSLGSKLRYVNAQQHQVRGCRPDSLVALELNYVAGRLPVIAYEDIGVADLPTLLWTKQVAATIPVQTEAKRRRIATAIAGRGSLRSKRSNKFDCSRRVTLKHCPVTNVIPFGSAHNVGQLRRARFHLIR
jgi:hypothetical protein